MPGDDIGTGTDTADQRAKPHAERLDADQIELRQLRGTGMAEPLARIIFAKAGRLDQRFGFEFETVGPGVANDAEGQDWKTPSDGNYELSRTAA